MVPNAEDEVFVLGLPRFRWLKTFENWASKFSPTRSVKRNFLASAIEKFLVPGPTRLPTLEVPYRPMLLAGVAKAARSYHFEAVPFETFGSPTMSGRSVARRDAPVPDGSVPD